jgi:hypothetical protein
MVTVTYRNQSAWYTIIVRSETVSGSGPSTGGGGGITIDTPKWPWE